MSLTVKAGPGGNPELNLKEEQSPSFLTVRFTAAYDGQQLLHKKEGLLLDVSDIKGTNCYCDDVACEQLEKRISSAGSPILHFIDSGNYHYMTSFWLRRITEPFRLIVFDHHTDMQEPAFGEILSCGGWISYSLRKYPMLREVMLIGPEEEDLKETDPHLLEKVRWYPESVLNASPEDKLFPTEEILPDRLPVYISIDKDIMSKEYAGTSWTQGNTSLPQLLAAAERLFISVSEKGIKLYGVDICGEADPPSPGERRINETANMAFLELVNKYFKLHNYRNNINKHS